MRTAASFDIDTLTVQDMAELLCVSSRTVWRWVASGRIPAPVRIGCRSTRWRVGDVQRYIDELPEARQR